MVSAYEEIGGACKAVHGSGSKERVLSSIQYDDKGNITSITFGQWAKLPRGRGVLDTCTVNYSDIALLDPEEIKVEPQPEKTVEKKTASKMRLGSFDSRVVRQETLD